MLTADRKIAVPAENTPIRTEDEPVDIVLEEQGISLGESIRLAFTSLMANKLRTILTSLGVIIGVMAVIALLAIGKGSQDAIAASITANGSNMLTVRGGAANAGGARGQFGSGQTLTIQDAQAIADPNNVPAALLVSPESGGGGAQLVAGSQNLGARITGAQPSYQQIHNLSLADGEFVTDAEVTSIDNVVVLGANVAQTLYPGGSPVGQSLRIRGQTFRVVGVLNAQGGSGFGSTDDGVIVPISTAQRKLFGDRAITGGGGLLVSSIVVQARDANSINAALDQISTVLRDRHQLPANGTADDFSIINQQDILNTAVQSTKVLTLFLGAIAAISLLVGGIGIMNIMLVSVRERTREIGLRKALGAREKDILTQFLIEALSLSTAGGLIGCILGMLIAFGVNLSGIVQASVAPLSVVMSIGFAMAVGLFFGIEPARRAAALSPIVALRYD
ncbi:MAG: ABC transporter permease [Herpetosiphonaceae bacterium]|nr:ABC transporter permease [Herpetosiphonaceae bacterium]